MRSPILLGATDKTDQKALPLYPEGYVDPFGKPIHPQKHGELMTWGVSTSPTAYRPFSRLSEVQIGHKTAYELGWISRIEFEEFYGSR